MCDDCYLRPHLYNIDKIVPSWQARNHPLVPSRRSKPKTCHYCGASAGTRDHIVPRARGGPTSKLNLVWACYKCNQAKADNPPDCACGTCRKAVELFMPVARV